jgi:protein-S-isoprenylcysteine O-methyltransferase Ste14
MLLIQVFLLILLISYILTLVLASHNVRMDGSNPRGVDDKYGSVARVGSFAIFLWVAIVVAYIINPQLMGWFVVITPFESINWAGLGIVVCSIGGAMGFLGMVTLGTSFRFGFPEKETQLITHGIYGKTRNPIVLSIFLMMIGTFLMIPNLLTIFNLIFNLVGFNAKASDEEVYLSQAFGQEWTEYASKTGKYLPRFRN